MKHILSAILLITGLSSPAFAENLQNIPEGRLYVSRWLPEKRNQMVREEIVRRNPEWPEEIREKILAGDVSVGMNKKQVRASWGRPSEIMRTEDDSGALHAVWIYDKAFLIFENERLVEYEKKVGQSSA